MKRTLLICLLGFGCDSADTVPLAPDVATPDAALADDAGPDGAVADATADDGAVPDSAAPDGAASDANLTDAVPADAGPDDGLDAGADSAADADLTDAADMGDEPDAPPPPPNVDVIGVDYSCGDPAYVPGACVAGEGVIREADGAAHIQLPEEIIYAENPPSSGSHRPQWGRWGEYDFIPKQRWLHNLEHGGIALLYHPCAPAETIEALRTLARARPEDDSGPFRWILTPYPDLPSTVAVMAWGWHYSVECVDDVLINGFIDRVYRSAPEDVRGDGGYSELWLGRGE